MPVKPNETQEIEEVNDDAWSEYDFGEMTEEEIVEFKASFGDPSEVPGPVKSKSKTAANKKEKPGHDVDDDATTQLKRKQPTSKAGVINAAVEYMSGLDKDELKDLYNSMYNEDLEEVDDDGEEISVKELATITTDDVDIAEDLDALFKGTDLTEESQDKIAVIFETAVVAKVNEIVEKFAIESESDLEVARMEVAEELTDKVDSYLDYVVQEWVEANELAIDRGIRADMMEDFMKGLKGLFEDHYVDIPEDKVDVVEELIAKVDELESKLDEQVDSNVELTGKVKDFEKEEAFALACEGLTATQTEKLRSLSESVEFDAGYAEKISMLKKQYFDIEEDTVQVVVDDEDNPITLDEEAEGEEKVPANMAGYMSAISRSVQK